ncbi:MAG: BrxA/BrxB family bacilliredoxin [Ignavibacteriales bacterium]|nr:BrxA/BrxB family bacilliredoxin [Ignavibacteriales bacterium]
MYPEELLQPMRNEVASLGIKEVKTAAAVDEEIKNSTGTVFVFVNSVCGCSAGSARPALKLALNQPIRPDKLLTVFAGQDVEATIQARKYFTGFPPSSPSMWLLRDGKVVHAVERRQIEGRPPQMIADHLIETFKEYCEVAA